MFNARLKKRVPFRLLRYLRAFFTLFYLLFRWSKSIHRFLALGRELFCNGLFIRAEFDKWDVFSVVRRWKCVFSWLWKPFFKEFGGYSCNKPKPDSLARVDLLRRLSCGVRYCFEGCVWRSSGGLGGWLLRGGDGYGRSFDSIRFQEVFRLGDGTCPIR